MPCCFRVQSEWSLLENPWTKRHNIHELPIASNGNSFITTHGTQIGDYFWIAFGNLAKTSLWSLKKEKWIQGPNLLDSGHAYFENFVSHDEDINPYLPETWEICLVGIGNGEAYIIIDGILVMGYNINTDTWSSGKKPPKFKNHDFYVSPQNPSCIFHQDKEYKRWDSKCYWAF